MVDNIPVPQFLVEQFIGKTNDEFKNIYSLLSTPQIDEWEENKINTIGMDLMLSEKKALHALQILLNNTGNKGNLPVIYPSLNNPFKYSGIIPFLEVRLSEYLTKYGVRKTKTNRGMEFNSNQREIAISALKSLNDKQFLIYYTDKHIKGNDKDKQILTIRPLIQVEFISKMENSSINRSKKTHIRVQFSPLFVNKIQNYFILRPANFYEEITLATPHSSNIVYNFFDYILLNGNRQLNKTSSLIIKKEIKKLAYRLRMDSYVKYRNWSAIKNSLIRCCQTGIKTGWIQSFDFQQGEKKENLIIILNASRFCSSHVKNNTEQHTDI